MLQTGYNLPTTVVIWSFQDMVVATKFKSAFCGFLKSDYFCKTCFIPTVPNLINIHMFYTNCPKLDRYTIFFTLTVPNMIILHVLYTPFIPNLINIHSFTPTVPNWINIHIFYTYYPKLHKHSHFYAYCPKLDDTRENIQLNENNIIQKVFEN